MPISIRFIRAWAGDMRRTKPGQEEPCGRSVVLVQDTQIKRIGRSTGNERPQRIDRGACRRRRPGEWRHRDRRPAGSSVIAAERRFCADEDILEADKFCRRDKTCAVNRRGAGEGDDAGDWNGLRAQGKACERQHDACGLWG